MTEYQVTLIDKNNHFRPVSTIVKVEGEFVKQDVINKGIQKICNQRYWTKKKSKPRTKPGMKQSKKLSTQAVNGSVLNQKK